jgi:hypothetical protein
MLAIGPVHAQGRELASPDPDRWWYEVAPYLWATAIHTEAGIGPIDAEADYDFNDILENLNGALMLHGEAHRNHWSIFGDAMYANIESEDDVGTAGEIDLDVRQTVLELGGAYTFGEKKAKFDVLFGARGLYINYDIDITGTAGGAASSDSHSLHAGPLVGGRFRYDFTSRWWAGVRGDASGFGIDDATTWSATGLVGYRFTELFSMAFGYRYLAVDIEDGNLDLELDYQGPLVGFGFTF